MSTSGGRGGGTSWGGRYRRRHRILPPSPLLLLLVLSSPLSSPRKAVLGAASASGLGPFGEGNAGEDGAGREEIRRRNRRRVRTPDGGVERGGREGKGKRGGGESGGGNGSGGSAAPRHLHVDEPPPRPVLASVPGSGKAIGRREESVDVWRGLPYAAPPVGHLRFAPPEPVQPWHPARLDASKVSGRRRGNVSRETMEKEEMMRRRGEWNRIKSKPN